MIYSLKHRVARLIVRHGGRNVGKESTYYSTTPAWWMPSRLHRWAWQFLIRGFVRSRIPMLKRMIDPPNPSEPVV